MCPFFYLPAFAECPVRKDGELHIFSFSSIASETSSTT
jgi:hypothetical protein